MTTDYTTSNSTPGNNYWTQNSTGYYTNRYSNVS